MISSYNPQTAAFLAGMSAIQSRAEKAQREMTTGLKINAISDAPNQVRICGSSAPGSRTAGRRSSST